MKYAQSGWWNTSALTLASGSIIMPSVSCTPISSGLQQLPDALLVVQVRAGRIAEAVALAAIAGREALLHGHGRRIGEAPILADAAVQPLGAAFGGLDGQRLDRVRLEELARLLSPLRTCSRMPSPAVTTNSAMWSRCRSSGSRM